MIGINRRTVGHNTTKHCTGRCAICTRSKNRPCPHQASARPGHLHPSPRRRPSRAQSCALPRLRRCRSPPLLVRTPRGRMRLIRTSTSNRTSGSCISNRGRQPTTRCRLADICRRTSRVRPCPKGGRACSCSRFKAIGRAAVEMRVGRSTALALVQAAVAGASSCL